MSIPRSLTKYGETPSFLSGAVIKAVERGQFLDKMPESVPQGQKASFILLGLLAGQNPGIQAPDLPVAACQECPELVF
jgi:hypothetical protein